MSHPKLKYSSLDILLLKLLESGVNTVCALHIQGGISIGAAVPALRRLEKAGLVGRMQTDFRRRQEFSVTSSGSRALESGLPDLVQSTLSSRYGDAETLVRLAVLCLHAHNRKSALAILELADTQNFLLAPAEIQSDAHSDIGSMYKQMLANLAQTRMQAETNALKSMKKRIQEGLSPTAGNRSANTRKKATKAFPHKH